MSTSPGKTLGRTKLTDISPKKTVEGAIGGLVSSVGAAVALWKLTSWPATPLAAAGLGVSWEGEAGEAKGGVERGMAAFVLHGQCWPLLVGGRQTKRTGRWSGVGGRM